jgi:CheY-like chemotaxis protein
LKILAVDDHPVVLVGLRLLFGDHPRFRICAEAATADQARAFAEAWAPDVVVTDLVMGGRDGLFLIEDLATICPASAIIVYSSHDDDVQTTLALRAGAHAFVPKTESLESVEGAIEAVLAAHPAVAECAVIGVADEIKGQVPRGFVVLKAGARSDGLERELVAAVRHSIGAVACLNLVDVVPALPKTRSGKILRKTMRGIADGRDEPAPSTIEDAGVLDTLVPILRNEAPARD